MRTLQACILFLVLNIPISAQLSFMRTYGPGDAQCVRQTADSGFVVTGVKDSASLQFPFFMKTGPTGIPQWNIVFPSQPGGGFSTALVFPTGYFFSLTSSFSDSTYLIWTNLNGYITHATTITGEIRATAISGDGLIIGTGLHEDDLFACKFDGQGTLSWSHSWDFGNSWKEFGNDIFEVENSNIVIGAEFVGVFGTTMFNFIKITPGGTIIHNNSVSANATFSGYKSVCATMVGNKYIFCGKAYNTSGQYHGIVISTDTALNVLSTTMYANSTSSLFFSATPKSGGGFAALRSTRTVSGYIGYYSVVTFDASMNLTNEFIVNTPAIINSGFRDSEIIQSNDDGFVFTGQALSNVDSSGLIMLVKLNSNGLLTCWDSLDIPAPITLTGYVSYNYLPTLTGNAVTQSYFQQTLYAPVTDSLWCMNNPQGVGFTDHLSPHSFSLQSTVVTDVLTLRQTGEVAEHVYTICNSVGAVVVRGQLDDSQQINVSGLAPGIYILCVDEFSAMKFVKI